LYSDTDEYSAYVLKSLMRTNGIICEHLRDISQRAADPSLISNLSKVAPKINPQPGAVKLLKKGITGQSRTDHPEHQKVDADCGISRKEEPPVQEFFDSLTDAQKDGLQRILTQKGQPPASQYSWWQIIFLIGAVYWFSSKYSS